MDSGKIKLSNFSLAKSLLQKAVRRGHVGAIGRASGLILAQENGRTWLNSRSKIITFEESWPIAGYIFCGPGGTQDPAPLLTCALHSKQKDAAGLGMLAVAHSLAVDGVMEAAPDRRAVTIVCAAMERPGAFWSWAAGAAPDAPARNLVAVAQHAVKAAYAPADIATIYAAAYLATQAPLPALRPVLPDLAPFPWWVAADKHTAIGVEVLSKVARELGQTYQEVASTLFFIEGSVVNHLEPSPWWAAAVRHRFLCQGIREERAIRIVEFYKKKIVEIIGDCVEKELAGETQSRQLNLFGGMIDTADAP